MSDDELLELFNRVRFWTQGDQRAPHKALVLLLALAQLQRGGGRWLAFSEVEPKLRQLLVDFGPHRRNVRPDYPFWRLRNDGIWTVLEEDTLLPLENAAGDVPVSALREVGARGGFNAATFELLKRRPELVNLVAERLLTETFPPSVHDLLLDAVGFPWIAQGRPQRDPWFREEILRIYERRCAICGYDGRLGSSELGIEAAHVKWHAAGGPDEASNGLALCSFHHLAFDRGAISLDDSLRILVSQDVSGQSNVTEFLIRFSGVALRGPQRGTPSPHPDYLAWHRREVFWDPPRSHDCQGDRPL